MEGRMVRTLGRSLSCEGKQGNRRYVNWDEILWPIYIMPGPMPMGPGARRGE